ncbi:MAG TPA: EamA family transporter RarD [Jatrophihabitantaceae bacterium]|jgi:chloramphenicol-sensitive protein RarD|nr:EamA family transporter RarD [Jatrophihabitantaceae bacterium]
MAERDESRRGLVYGASAYLLWGLFPLYWPLLKPAGTIEILAQRMAWSLVVVLILLRVTSGFASVRRVLASRRQRTLLFAAALAVTVNWGTYIWGVNTHHVVETSLGYFINPLFTILLGVIVLGERLRRAQWIAVGIGAVAVVVIAVDYGHPPWIALTLATSFGLYGFFKKQAAVGAVDSLAVETSAMFVPAVIALTVIAAQGHMTFGRHGVGNALLLAGTGVVTVIPLLFFAAGTRRLPLSVLGLLQYLAPVLQFAVGVGIRHESTPAAELVGFGLVWVALTLLTVDGLRAQRSAVHAARAAESAAV